MVLVEGPTESLALPVYLEKRGLQVAKEGIAIVPVHGKGNLAKWRRLFVAYEIPCYVIFDNDAHDDTHGTKRKDALKAVGIPEEDQDQYITTADWLVEDEFAVFGSNFETALRDAFAAYAELEEQAREHGIDSKPFIARWVAESACRPVSLCATIRRSMASLESPR